MAVSDNGFADILAKFELALRNGHVALVARALSELDFNSIPAEWRLPLAQVCLKSGMLTIGLKLLTPVKIPSPAEAAEYALMLQRSGLTREALRRLSAISVQEAPESALYRAFAHFSIWDYESAIADLEEYLPYAPPGQGRVTAEVHLAAALVHAGHATRAFAKLDEIIAKYADNPRTVFDVNNLRAHMYYITGDIPRAKAALEISMGLAQQFANFDPVLMNKWSAAIAARESGSLAPLKDFRNEALRRHDYESVREADLLCLQIEFNRETFEHLYFGTPFEAYRARARLVLGQSPQASEYIFGERASTSRLDLQTGEIKGHTSLSQGSKVHQLFDVLLRDFYKPAGVGALFSELFPNEQYDVEHSPDRVHQILRRARRFIEASNLPVSIVNQNGAFSLQVTGALAIRVPLERPLPDMNAIQLQQLRTHFAEEPFSARDARAALSLSPAEFKRLAAWGVESGTLQRIGASSATIYALSRRKAAA